MIRYLAHALDLALLGALVLFIALGLVLSVSGCSTFLPTADRVSLVANSTIRAAQHEAQAARAAQLDACTADASVPAATENACLDAGEAQWAPWLAFIEVLRQLAADFDDVLDSAGRLGDSPDVEHIVLETACDLLNAWDRAPAAFALLEPLHLSFHPPELPPELDQLLHGGASFLCTAPAQGAR